MSRRKQNIVDVISLPHENFIFLFIRVLPRSTLHRSAIPFSGHMAPFFFSYISKVLLGDCGESADCSSRLMILVLFIVCDCLIGTCCLNHCPNALISIHNILRKERASVFCRLFRYLLFHIQDLSSEKLVMSDLDISGKIFLGMLPDILFDMYVFLPLGLLVVFFLLLASWLFFITTLGFIICTQRN